MKIVKLTCTNCHWRYMTALDDDWDEETIEKLEECPCGGHMEITEERGAEG